LRATALDAVEAADKIDRVALGEALFPSVVGVRKTTRRRH
jgi:hypothetical protein